MIIRASLSTLLLVPGLLLSSAASAQVECGEEYLDQLQAGVFTVCKVAANDSTEFPYEVTAEGTGLDNGGSLVPAPVLQNGDCVDVYKAPSGSGIPPDMVTITELVPEGWKVDGICVLNIAENDSDGFDISSHEYPAGTETIQGQIDANKIGCVAIYTNSQLCGDGVLDEGEECDDGNNVDGDRCSAECTIEPFCGDGVLDEGEGCDDGNNIDGDGCSSKCTIEPFCGDGYLDEGEECDDGNNRDGDGCDSTCMVEPFCGDGTLDPGEQCDDGNNESGDGCSPDCTFERDDEGCTPGYWKQQHHFDSWVDYDPSDSFEAIFDVDVSFGSPTLLEALQAGGGGESALLRHATAALLNAANDEVDYFETVDGVIDRVQDAYESGEFESLKNLLDRRNNDGCPLNGGPGDGGEPPDEGEKPPSECVEPISVGGALSSEREEAFSEGEEPLVCEPSAAELLGCGLGAELSLVLAPLMWLWRRRSRH